MWRAHILSLTILAAVPYASAADVVSIPLSTPTELPIHDEAGFDWDGFYAGVYGAVIPGGDDIGVGLGAQVGINAQFDFLLVGAEVAVEGVAGEAGSTPYGQILARAGLVVTDDVVVFAAGGYGITLGGNELDAERLLGGGVELAVADNFTLDAQYLGAWPDGATDTTHKVTLGANFHF
jgi:outer membrane immunogenic protein